MIRKTSLDKLLGSPELTWTHEYHFEKYYRHRYRFVLKNRREIQIVYNCDSVEVDNKYKCETISDLKKLLKILNKLSDYE